MDVSESDPGPSAKERELPFHCDLCCKELVQNISKMLLPGLATACLDNTTGHFRGPASVATSVRSELVDYLNQRSKTHLSNSPAEDPTECISVFLNDFATSKRNLFSRVSGWLSSEKREEKMEDLVQEMERNALWPVARRDATAASVLRNLDPKSAFHCTKAFDSAQRLAEHKTECIFRITDCRNEGCSDKFSAIEEASHDSACPFKIIPCQQKCPENVVRSEMDEHCSTVCTMRPVSCPFHQIGCAVDIPQGNLQEHCSESLHPHLLCLFQAFRKQESSSEELKQHVKLLEKSQSLCELSESLDVRSLMLIIKEQETRMSRIDSELKAADVRYLKRVIEEQEEKMKKLERELDQLVSEKQALACIANI